MTRSFSFAIVIVSCLALAGCDMDSIASDTEAQIELPAPAQHLPIVGDIEKGKQVAKQWRSVYRRSGAGISDPLIAGISRWCP